MKTLFDFDDILIEPKPTSTISSRSFIKYTHGDHLPLFAAPMDTVVDETNSDIFLNLGINVCLPRGENAPEFYTPDRSMTFESYSLKDFNRIVSEGKIALAGFYLIDMANGHMEDMVEAVINSKNKYPSIALMVGNVAHPDTYRILSEAGADYIRVGIGNGNGCLTTQQTGIGYPMASLIRGCYEASTKLKDPAKIVADGGMKKYADVIKALALGADYVMIGSLFNKALESCSDTVAHSNDPMIGNWKIDQYSDEARNLLRGGTKLTKEFRGMSTKKVQRKWGTAEEDLKTSEGIVKYQDVEYTLEQWKENFISYLTSAMSYTDSRTLKGFIGEVKYNLITPSSFKRFNK